MFLQMNLAQLKQDKHSLDQPAAISEPNWLPLTVYKVAV